MTIKNDEWIADQAINRGLIDPFIPKLIRENCSESGFATSKLPLGPVISYGLSSYGYDLRCTNEFQLFLGTVGCEIDPKDFAENLLHFLVVPLGGACVIPPNTVALTQSVELLRIPRDVLAICNGKSTYARAGLLVHPGLLEPSWEGHVTLVLANTTRSPVIVHPYEGIAQVVFHQSDAPCNTSYADRAGKYQGGRGINHARV